MSSVPVRLPKVHNHRAIADNYCQPRRQPCSPNERSVGFQSTSPSIQSTSHHQYKVSRSWCEAYLPKGKLGNDTHDSATNAIDRWLAQPINEEPWSNVATVSINSIQPVQRQFTLPARHGSSLVTEPKTQGGGQGIKGNPYDASNGALSTSRRT